MRAHPYAEAAARAALWLLACVTALYCLLCSVEFSWQQFIHTRSYPMWVGLFLRFHPLLTGLAGGLAGIFIRGRRRWAWLAAVALACAADLRWSLADLSPGAWASTLTLLAWAPHLAWEALLYAQSPLLDWSPIVEDAGLARAGAASGLVAGLACAPSPSAVAVPWSLLVHAAFGCGVGLVLESVGELAAGAPRRRRAQTAAFYVLIGCGLSVALYLGAFVPISAGGLRGAAFCALFSASAIACLWRQACLAHRTRPARSAAAFLAAPAALIGLEPSTAAGQAAALAALLIWPRLARLLIGNADWNLLLANMSALLGWVAAAAFCRHALGREERRWRAAAPACLLALCLIAQSGMSRFDPDLRLAGFNFRSRAEALAQADGTLRALRRLTARARASTEFYSLLQRSTNIPRSVAVPPKDLKLSSVPPDRLAVKPNIFIFVIDSLRQDYLGAYNKAVGFTPAMDAFARDALVFHNAFTAYGATGLSEPSIWAGARLAHKQYVLPFSPMNCLDALTTSEGYRRFASMDTILAQLLDRAPEVKLDEHNDLDFKLVTTVSEFWQKLGPEPPSNPLFFYAQPQDIHISVIQREGAKPVLPGDFGGFYAPYASRLARIDEEFGRFIVELKRRGLYEDSIIVLTADHGDSLGEDGRWGHAYTLFPEILRVPLIVRVPERLKAGKVWDLDAPAFLIDVTPTLYTLLGRPPDLARDEVFGRSLIAADRAALEASVPKQSLLASSYGPVYGLLRERARRLYIADAINYQTYLYDLKTDPGGRRNLSDAAAEAELDPLLSDAVEHVNSFYEFAP